MLDPAVLLADFARGRLKVRAGPFFAATLTTLDQSRDAISGKLIATSGGAVHRNCLVQIDAAEGDEQQFSGDASTAMRCIILAAALEGDLDGEATIIIDDGPYANTIWQVNSLTRDLHEAFWIGDAVRV
jgi:hypothetical protein